jgi:uncharacterized delta-60 repeat protein
MRTLLIVFIIIFNSLIAHAQQAGSFDVSFGTDGYVEIAFTFPLFQSKVFQSTSMAIQPDGKIISAGGYVTSESINNGVYTSYVYHFLFARYNANGSLDNTFGNNGISDLIVDTAIELNPAPFTAKEFGQIALQADGKIIAECNTPQGKVIRLNSNGTFDTNFDGDGIKTINSISGITLSSFRNIAIQANGKILISATTQTGTTDLDFAMIRINTDGSLDLSFDTDGLKTIDFGGNDGQTGMTLQANEKIIVTGYSGINLEIARLNTDGSLDATFGVAGKQSIPIGTQYPYFSSVKVQSNNRIVVGTFIGGVGGNYSFYLLGLQGNGTLDPAFNGTGVVQTDFDNNANTNDYINNIEILSDDKIIVLGTYSTSNVYHTAIAQYLPNGNLDNSFNGNGKLTILSGGFGNMIKKQVDGKIVVNFSKNNFFKLARLHDVSNFNSNKGKIITQIGTGTDQANAVAIRPNGKIITGGYAYNAINSSSDNDFALIGYNNDGSLDYTFGSNGIVKTEISAFSNDQIKAISIQSDGKIVAAGTTGVSTLSNYAIVRYLADGSGLDPTFGVSGKVIVDFSGTQDYVSSIVIQNDGKIVVGGSTVNGSNADFSVIRLNTNGTLDNSFDVDGKVSTNLGAYNISSAIGLQTDGKIVVAGYNAGNFGVLRYNSNGSLDNTFDADGKVNITIGPSSNEGVFGLVIQPDGKILVSGNTNFAGTTDFAVIRLNSDGSLDTGFGSGGKFWIDINTNSEDFNPSIALHTSGKIVLAGIINAGTIGVCQINANGTLDTSFDEDGKLTFEIGYGLDQVKAMALQTDGKILLAGNYANGANDDFALVSLPACITSIISLSNPSDNYPNATLPNPQIGKSISATNLINTSANVIYRSSSSITLNAGFKADNGSIFKTEIVGCSY